MAGADAALPALHLAPRGAPGDATALLGAVRAARASVAAFFGGDAAAAAEGRAWLRDACARASMAADARGAALTEAAWRGGPDSAVGDAALRMLCAARPADVAALLAATPGAWERCFRGGGAGIKRAVAWFGAFAADGRHSRGAAALARYLLQRRDAAWRLAAWRGPHPQAPGVVAAKPGLFCELDVERTLAAMPPDFWACADVAESLRDGALVALDPAFCLAELRAAWRAGGDGLRSALRRALRGALAAEPPRRACHALLPAVAPDGELLRALRHWLPRRDADAALLSHALDSEPGAALAAAPFADVAWRTVADACAAAALARPGAAGGLEALLSERCAVGAPLAAATSSALEALLREAAAADAAPDGGAGAIASLLAAAAAESSPEEGRLTVLLAAHALRARLRRLPRDADVAEALLRAAGVAFRREAPPDADDAAQPRSRKKRKHRHKKRKKKHRRSRSRSDSDSDSDSDGSRSGAAPATWRCALDAFALPRDAAATAELLADAAADAWLRRATQLADARRRNERH